MKTNTKTTIKITPELRKQINKAVRDNVGGASPLAEVGLRGDDWLPNALKWAADSDLGDLVRLASLREIDTDERFPGCAELDLYVTTGTGCDRQLETNVCVLIRDGAVVGATSEGRQIAELKQRVGFPVGDWDTPVDGVLDDTPESDARFLGITVDELQNGGKPWQPATLTLDEKVAIELARRDRSVDAWGTLPIVACSGIGCDQKFRREHDAQTICRDCMSYEPGTFTFYPIGDERAPWHARTQKTAPQQPAAVDPDAQRREFFETRARQLMLVPDAFRRFVAIYISGDSKCPDCGTSVGWYETDVCTHARLCQNGYAPKGGAL